jgi:hypothetical protein
VMLKSQMFNLRIDVEHAIRAMRFLADGTPDSSFQQGTLVSDTLYQLSQRDDAAMVRAAQSSIRGATIDIPTRFFCSAVRQSTGTPRIEATLVEYYHPQLDHYFLTLDGAESALLDANVEKMGWQRTGFTMGAWGANAPGGAVPVCRFYGDPVIGPNSHFYTPVGPECDGLRQLEQSTPAGQPVWHLEGLALSVAVPSNGACPANLTPVYRLFNGKSGAAGDPNHRYTTSNAVIAQMKAKGWFLEGLAFCVPPQASRTTLSVQF